MTVYLTAQQILFIHARLIDATGGEHGVRDLGLLEAAVARPQATFDGTELYASLFEKAAALMESLVRNHPFVDGNKRTAVTAASLFLLQNRRRLETTNEKVERVTLWVVNERPPLKKIAAWFQEHTIDLAR
jgi:death on curing protein